MANPCTTVIICSRVIIFFTVESTGAYLWLFLCQRVMFFRVHKKAWLGFSPVIPLISSHPQPFYPHTCITYIIYNFSAYLDSNKRYTKLPATRKTAGTVGNLACSQFLLCDIHTNIHVLPAIICITDRSCTTQNLSYPDFDLLRSSLIVPLEYPYMISY